MQCDSLEQHMLSRYGKSISDEQTMAEVKETGWRHKHLEGRAHLLFGGVLLTLLTSKAGRWREAKEKSIFVLEQALSHAHSIVIRCQHHQGQTKSGPMRQIRLEEFAQSLVKLSKDINSELLEIDKGKERVFDRFHSDTSSSSHTQLVNVRLQVPQSQNTEPNQADQILELPSGSEFLFENDEEAEEITEEERRDMAALTIQKWWKGYFTKLNMQRKLNLLRYFCPKLRQNLTLKIQEIRKRLEYRKKEEELAAMETKLENELMDYKERLAWVSFGLENDDDRVPCTVCPNMQTGKATTSFQYPCTEIHKSTDYHQYCLRDFETYFEFQEEVVEILRQRDVTCRKMEDMKKTSDDELAVQILRLSGELSTDSISMEIKGIERSRTWGERGGLQDSLQRMKSTISQCQALLNKWRYQNADCGTNANHDLEQRNKEYNEKGFILEDDDIDGLEGFKTVRHKKKNKNRKQMKNKRQGNETGV